MPALAEKDGTADGFNAAANAGESLVAAMMQEAARQLAEGFECLRLLCADDGSVTFNTDMDPEHIWIDATVALTNPDGTLRYGRSLTPQNDGTFVDGSSGQALSVAQTLSMLTQELVAHGFIPLDRGAVLMAEALPKLPLIAPLADGFNAGCAAKAEADKNLQTVDALRSGLAYVATLSSGAFAAKEHGIVTLGADGACSVSAPFRALGDFVVAEGVITDSHQAYSFDSANAALAHMLDNLLPVGALSLSALQRAENDADAPEAVKAYSRALAARKETVDVIARIFGEKLGALASKGATVSVEADENTPTNRVILEFDIESARSALTFTVLEDGISGIWGDVSGATTDDALAGAKAYLVRHGVLPATKAKKAALKSPALA